MLQKFKKHLSKNFSALKDQKFLLALSGGLDSCVLLDLCLKAGIRPVLAHCNFQLRPNESDADAQWIQTLAEEKGLEIHIKNFDTQAEADRAKVSIQMAARDLRYKWFDRLSAELGYDQILVAHHADDALETFMINTMRGTGLKGLLGIPEQRGKIYRPLLSFTRKEILQYADENKIQWREDGSNAKTDYLRNALRHEVIPLWKQKEEHFDVQFQETLQYLGQAQVLLEKLVEDFKTTHFVPENGNFKISVDALKNLTSLDYYLHALFGPYGFKNLNDLKQLMQSQSGKQLFSPTHRLIKDRECFLLTVIVKSPETESYSIDPVLSSIETPLKLSFSVQKIRQNEDSKSLCLDKSTLKFPLTLRKWKQSDYFYPNGMKGRKKLSKYFKDEKFSLVEKESQWLLCSGEDIVWVIGKRADQRFLAHAGTEKKWFIRYDD